MLKDIAYQIPGKRLDKKVVIFESDDWGGERTPNKKVLEHCVSKGFSMYDNIYASLDTLESKEDVNLLAQVLDKHSTEERKVPFTFNTILSNPNYQKIKADNYENYHFIPIHDSDLYKDAFHTILSAKEEGLVSTQYHGREHINVSRWLTSLQRKDANQLFAFSQGMAGIFPKSNVRNGNDMVVALEHYDQDDLKEKLKILKNGLDLFKKIFGEDSLSAISCNYVWSKEAEVVYFDSGVRLLQSSKAQLIPIGKFQGFKKVYHFTGTKNRLGQYFSVRNVLFEPSYNQERDWVDTAMHQIRTAFWCKKPAIISSHRMNYCSGLSVKNRDESLRKLDHLIYTIKKQWPETDFCTSDSFYLKYLQK